MSQKSKVIAVIAVCCFLLFVGVMIASVQRQEHAITEERGGFTTGTRVYFSPNGGCTEAIVASIAEAKTTILVQMYSFTSDPIEQALIAAKNRGIAVRVILDHGQLNVQGGAVMTLAQAGVEVWIDRKHAIAHNKVMIIDDYTVLTGSFNYSAAAENRNAENLLIIKNATLTGKYKENFSLHLGHSERYVLPQ
jgi:phosphatidylserine/phosphatidylglycerophosphate/cardiolipin synthase-like enzyme